MNQNTNSVAPFNAASLAELQEAAGVTQFPDDKAWYQIVNGLQIQGGQANIAGGVTATIDLSAPYKTQVLGIFINPVAGAPNGGYVDTVTLDHFTIVNGASGRNYYWWAIGV